MEARAGDTISDVGEWSGLVNGGRADAIEGRRCIQYRLRFATDRPSVSAVLTNICFEAIGLRRTVHRIAPE